MSVATLASPPPVPGVVARLLQFARLLRDNGFSCGPDIVADAVAVLADEEEPPRVRFLRELLKALFCKRQGELSRFDDIFDAYWLGAVGSKRTLTRQVSASAQSVLDRNAGTEAGSVPKGLAHYFEWRALQPANENDAEVLPAGEDADSKLGGASLAPSTQTADFGKVSDPEEAEKLMQLAERLGARLRHRLSRRYKASSKGARIDFRQSFRKAMATGGKPWRLSLRRRRQPPVRLVIFVDVSASMDSFSIFFARFMHALMQGCSRADAFLFHTNLLYVSDVFRSARSDVAMEKLGLIARGWSGGTRIGDALLRFDRDYADRLGGSRTVAILMTDGYDAGDPEVLEEALQRLKRHCRRLIWLNPLLGRATYRPDARGARELLAQADLALPAHNLNSLKKLEESIGHV